MATRCCKKVSDRDARFPRYHQCKHFAVVERDGNSYCKIHDPEFVKQKDEDQRAKWAAESKARQDRWERDRLCHDACKGLSNDQLKELANLDRSLILALL